MRGYGRLWALSVMTSIGLGCAGAGGGDAPQSAVRRASAELVCHMAFACPSASSILAGFSVTFPTEEDCVEGYRTPVSPALEAAFDRGTVVVDEDAMAECMAELGESCPPVGVALLPHACSYYLRGTVPLGGACTLMAECADGICDVPAGQTCGTCRAGTVPLGGSCSIDGQCAPSAQGEVQCLVDSTYHGTCQLPKPLVFVHGAEGASCGAPADANGNQYVCGDGLFCDGSRHCRRVLSPGETCVPGTDACVIGAACISFGNEARCRGLTRRTNVGESCSVADATTMYLCDDAARLVCDENQTCQRIGDGKVGAACAFTTHCDDGLFCAVPSSQTRGVCEAEREDGRECLGPAQCRSGYCEIPAGSSQGVCGKPVVAACTAS